MLEKQEDVPVESGTPPVVLKNDLETSPPSSSLSDKEIRSPHPVPGKQQKKQKSGNTIAMVYETSIFFEIVEKIQKYNKKLLSSYFKWWRHLPHYLIV